MYWILKFYKYYKYEFVTECKPYSDFSYTNSYYGIYMYFIKSQTLYKAYLVSYLMIYKILKSFFNKNNHSNKNRLLKTLYIVQISLKLIGWTIVRLVTSLPRAVILDSYHFSNHFYNYKHLRLKDFNKDLFISFSYGFNERVIQSINDVIVPIMFYRVYKTDHAIFNFNP